MTTKGPLGELLNKWRGRRIALMAMSRRQYEDSPETNKTILAMEVSLAQCIRDLEEITEGYSVEKVMARQLINDWKDNAEIR